MRLPLWPLGLVALAGCSGEDERRPVPADRIYVGRVLTMDDRRPRAEAVALRDGHVLAVGSKDEVLQHRDEQTIVTFLASGCVVPGFVEAHGHLVQVALRTGTVPLEPPPLGGVASISDLVETLRGGLARRERGGQLGGQLGVDDWLIGWGYDHGSLAEGRHPTRHDLDRVAADRPIVVIHRSGHVVALNSAGLVRVGINDRSRNPPGGRIHREPVGGPTGVLEGAAVRRALAPLRELRADPARFDAAVREAMTLYASRGVTTCQEAQAGPEAVAALRAAATRAPLPLDLVVFVGSHGNAAERLLGREDPTWGTYAGGLRLGGVSLSLDGSLLGRTAWLTAPYHRLPGNPLELAACDDPLSTDAAPPPTRVGALYAGYPALRGPELDRQLRRFRQAGWDVMAHCQGDAAADQLLAALERVREEVPDGAGRVSLVHALTLRDDQLDRMAALDVVPSFFVGQVRYWGERHRDLLLGPERAARLAPVAAASARGLAYTLHEDAPTTPPDPLRSVATAALRRTASGDVLGPEQRVTIEEALKAVTLHPARLLGEDAKKGSIEVGKVADLAILSADPTRCDEATLRRIEVLQTLKRGLPIYRRGAAVTGTR